ncbi:MAG TPA: hypothetical protein VG370_22255 [Chloroflexota bacterium]|nr:hypothetical protein [Chloroflexota bacterium]
MSHDPARAPDPGRAPARGVGGLDRRHRIARRDRAARRTPADVAAALRDLEPDEALAVFGQIDDARAAEVLDELDPELTRYGADGAVASRRPSR